MLDQLQELKGSFWTKAEELISDIEAMGLEVEEAYEDYIEAVDEDEETYIFHLITAGNTIAIADIH